ncbi:hypothetical protein A2130_02145 [Candidatus Woesebacteria bacterium GWC2_33_12]|uniref:Uncharacterized protein n=1 Tax=Candidatus Woesebacteria bacterium GW2011_GWB1_33_22 TaxID=1618566 RepID=A0A0F9ZIM7_9BACT|nr:MAG: hypothetical protein UR29_C0014G0016 [Candidatus Woesebacteria bacterium GW2011_GWC2_33_12]KKP41589.1 MAG: hypothetical protein UR33_C0012G0015 [Candidatus Woesebacteria bacterium GW2011_GWA2_33_20]KKP44063.1 MAG: hypothetical protein UR35_C0012G0020 [Candidatus Woesebacteria bacterium GW2011_GWB1_33_22]KKP45724.1 MAG: hypothetical protein UR37_C0015G0020 [Microgenomates group bacterium GW2011_GWC1_33_28]KKP49586.1 MAG: hypothetical protein UR41_C0013G0020 [Candidatus Woesebacteria bact
MNPENQTPIMPTAESPQSVAKPNNFLIILLSTLLFISLVIAGFFAYQTQKLVLELQGIRNEELVTQTATPEPVATTDPTTDWKEIENKEYNFIFKYPTDWKLSESLKPDNTNWYSGNIYQLISPNASVDHGEVANGSYLTINVVKPDPNYSNFDEYRSFSANQYKYKYSQRKVNDIEGFVFSENNKIVGFAFENKGLFIVINWIYSETSEFVDQILSTFKFTN